MRTLKIVVALLTIFWMGIWLAYGISTVLEVPQAQKKRKTYFEKEFKPSIDFLDGYQKTNNRLPTPEEFNQWAESAFKYHLLSYERCDHYPCGIEQVNGEDPLKYYVLRAWNGDDWDCYYSWNRVFDADVLDYDYAYGLLLRTILIASIPLLFLAFVNFVRRL